MRFAKEWLGLPDSGFACAKMVPSAPGHEGVAVDSRMGLGLSSVIQLRMQRCWVAICYLLWGHWEMDPKTPPSMATNACCV